MGREHLEFLETTEMPWEEVRFPGFSEEVKQKQLSQDPSSGASTSILKLSPGTVQINARYTEGIEGLLLTGDLEIGNENLGDLTHFYIEPGICFQSLTTKGGCELLFMTEGKLELTDGGFEVKENGVRLVHTSEVPWEGTITPGFPTGAMRKSLYQNSETGASSWLLGVLPHFKDNRYEIHPVMEEGFQINGELDTSRGPFKEGSYFWRPSEIPHGNFNTKRGCLTFFRTDGPLKTTYVDASDLN